MLLKITARRDSTVSSSALHPAEVASKENISTISPNSLASNASLILTPPPPKQSVLSDSTVCNSGVVHASRARKTFQNPDVYSGVAHDGGDSF